MDQHNGTSLWSMLQSQSIRSGKYYESRCTRRGLQFIYIICILLYLLTYLLTPWSRVLLEKLTGSAASQEIPHIFGTRRFLTILTIARHLSVSWVNSPKTMSLFRCLLRDTSSRNTPPRRSEWGNSLPPDRFVSRGSISTCEYFLTWVFTGRRC